MLIIPAIDLKMGTCVRLIQGQFDKTTTYSVSAHTLIQEYMSKGANYIHVVDLDGAKTGELAQLPFIESLLTPNLTLQLGGGIRTIKTAQSCLDAKIQKLVIGSMAITSKEETLKLIQAVGADKIVLALDVEIENGIPKTVTHGWQKSTDCTLWDVVELYQNIGISEILCTDIAKDGMMQGPNFELYEEACRRFPNISWFASGGIRNREDIKKLSDLKLSGVILGRMLYESNFDLKACILEFSSC